MQITIRAEPGEVAAKSGQILAHLEKSLGGACPELGALLRKAGRGAETMGQAEGMVEPQRALRELGQEMQAAYDRQIKAMMTEVNQVLDRAAAETPAVVKQ